MTAVEDSERMDDQERVRRALLLEKEGRDYRMMDVPGYTAWSERKIREGESGALIAHLDATSMWLTPDGLSAVSEAEFEEMLEDLKETIGEPSG